MESHVEPQDVRESKSSVKLTLNSKGDAQIELKVVAGETQDEMDRIRILAAQQFTALRQEIGR